MMIDDAAGSTFMPFGGQDASADDQPSDDDDDYLTDWERDFLASVGGQDYDLTPAQEAKLAEIEALVEERRAVAWERYGGRRRRAPADRA